MKVILSRKGFDSSNGGMPSPILQDGTLLSMSIPEAIRNCNKDSKGIYKYSDLEDKYQEIYKDLYKTDINNKSHLDPDIGLIKRRNSIDGWKSAFGQSDAALSHLMNQMLKLVIYFCFLDGLGILSLIAEIN